MVMQRFRIGDDRAADQADLAGRLVLYGVAFPVIALSLTWLGLALDIGVSRFHLMMAGVLSYGAAFGLCRHGRVLSESNQACAGVAVCLFASAWFAAQIFDTSYDGMAYHQAGAIAFSLGWNPIYQPHVVGWWLDAYPSSGELGRFIANGGLWVDHYAKGSWVLGALMHSATGSLNATKWVSPYLSVIAALSVYRGMRDCAIGRHPAAFLSFSAAFSPVVVAQFGTNYVDGAMASALLIQCGAFLSWNVRRSSLDIFVVLFAATLAFQIHRSSLFGHAALRGGGIGFRL